MKQQEVVTIEPGTARAIDSIVSEMMVDVAGMQEFCHLLEEHGDAKLQGLAALVSVTMKHIDNRIQELDKLMGELSGHLNAT